jgi:hypothetical protein
MSALPPKADIGSKPRHVRFVPKADIQRFSSSSGVMLRRVAGKTVPG